MDKVTVETRRSCINISVILVAKVLTRKALQQTIPVGLPSSLVYYVGAPKLSAMF